LELIEHAGYIKKVDLRAYLVKTETANRRSVLLLERLTERLRRSGIVLRQINLKDFANEAKKIKAVYNKAWDKNLGFVPMTDEEFDYDLKESKMIVDHRYCIVAERGEDIVVFAFVISNIIVNLIHIIKGSLLPFGIFKLLFGLKKIKMIRVVMLAVLEEY